MISIYLHCDRHTHTFLSRRIYILYNHLLLIQRSTIGQSVFASFLMVAGYYVITALYVLLYSGRNYPTRLETRTKEFNWIASRRVSHKTLFTHTHGEAKAIYVPCAEFISHCSTGWLRICVVCFHSAYTYILRCVRLIKLKSTLVETRKMVNYARTWWSQVKTWWKLALCGTDVQIVAAWPEYRGERLIEPSSSWFPPKFPSG